MALPKSTLVMGVVTLGLFGVAIYETVGKKGGYDRGHAADEADSYEGDHDEDVDNDQAIAEYQRAAAERRADEETAKANALAAKMATLHELYGAEAASPGSLFAGVAFDAKTTPPDWVERRAAFMRRSGFRVTIGTGESNDRFEVFPSATLSSDDRDALCSELDTRLGTAWGSPNVVENGFELWTNNLAGIRASFRARGDCELVIERFDEPAAWLNKSTRSTVPYGWIGKPAKQVAEAVGADADGEVIEWTAHGVGTGTEQTKIQAFIEAGKVSHVIATTTASTPTRAALEETLRAQFGKPKPSDEDSSDLRLEWPTKNLTVVMSADGSIAVMNRKP